MQTKKSVHESCQSSPSCLRLLVLAQVKADKHHGEQTFEELQEHTVKTVKDMHDPTEEAEPEMPKDVPSRAHH